MPVRPLIAMLASMAMSLVACEVQAQQRPVILIGIDGFRADYLDRGVTPTLSRLASEGAVAEGGMRPSFPSLTAVPFRSTPINPLLQSDACRFIPEWTPRHPAS